MANEVKITGSARNAGGTKGGKTKVECVADDGQCAGTIYLPREPAIGTVLTFTIK